MERDKAGIAACGNEQLFGVAYNLTFVAVMELGTVRGILVLSRRWDVPARRSDVLKMHMPGMQRK